MKQFDINACWDYENGFYLTSHVTRIAKLLAHFELYKKICNLPGQVIECGVYKGASFVRFLTFREILEYSHSRKIIGFDAFGKFPIPICEHDVEFVKKFEREGGDGISIKYFKEVLNYKNFDNFELIKGDITKTIPEYIAKHPELKISLLHIDVDVYAPTVVILNQLYDRVVNGGLIVIDDYGTVVGETKAVDEFISDKELQIEKLPISHVPAFIKK